MTQAEIDVLKHEFGFDDITDPEALRSAIEAQFAAMNPLDRATIQARIGMRLAELEAMPPGARYSPATWSLLITCVLYLAFTAGIVFFIVWTHAWLIIKIIAGIFALFWFLGAWRSAACTVYRLANGRDW